MLTRRKFLKDSTKSNKKEVIKIPSSIEEINKFTYLFNLYIFDLQKGILSPRKFKKAYEYLMEITKL